jgi:membrane protease YdiL (CAAX protease family)
LRDLVGVVLVGSQAQQVNPLRGLVQCLSVDVRSGLDLLAGAVIGAIAMGGIFLTLRALGQFTVAGFHLSPAQLALDSLYLFVGAFGEEVVFRGLTLPFLLSRLTQAWLAVLLMAVLFGLAHAPNPGASLCSVFSNSLGGIMYAIAFLGTGRIWLPLGLHVTWNLVQGPILGFPVSGLKMGGMLQLSPLPQTLLGGGSYGPEASIVGVLFRFVVIGLLLVWLRVRPGEMKSEKG